MLDPSLSYTYSALNTRPSPTFDPHSAVVDTGASFNFADINHPSILQWSIRPLDEHISIAQGSSAATCRHVGLALLVLAHATNPRGAMVLLVPVLVMQETIPVSSCTRYKSSWCNGSPRTRSCHAGISAWFVLDFDKCSAHFMSSTRKSCRSCALPALNASEYGE